MEDGYALRDLIGKAPAAQPGRIKGRFESKMMSGLESATVNGTLPGATDKPASIDILPVSVGTDPGLALLTRKGTGYYKIPSLKGVWYRGHYLHDGSVASLEEMFDPDRLRDTHSPGGYSPPGVQSRAIKGHEFGLKLNAVERDQLIAFLRTL